jgi:hypothetical protein
MKLGVVIIAVALLAAGTAAAQQRTVTISRHDSFSYRNRTAENLGYATAGLTAFLALLDSGTGSRQGGVPVPGYPTYPGPGPGGAWGGCGGVVVIPPPVIVDGAVICQNPSWCTWPSPLGPGPGADGFTAGYRAGQQWARERRIAGTVQYHTDYPTGLDAGSALYGW